MHTVTKAEILTTLTGKQMNFFLPEHEGLAFAYMDSSNTRYAMAISTCPKPIEYHTSYSQPFPTLPQQRGLFSTHSAYL